METLKQCLQFKGKAPLYCKYPQQLQPQPAYLEITPEGELGADYNAELGGIPADVWHKRRIWITLPANISAETIEGFVSDNLDKLQELYNSLVIDWDGRNFVGTFNEDLYEELQQLANDMDRCDVWSARDYVSDMVDTCIIAATAGQQVRIEDLAKDIIDNLGDDQVIFDEDNLADELLSQYEALL